MDLETVLQETRQSLSDAIDQREELELLIANLEAELHGLELAVQRRQRSTLAQGDSAESASVADDRRQSRLWSRKSRTDAIVDVLAELYPQTLGPKDITDQLHKKGRDDERDSVAAALAYLKGRGRVERVDYGAWRSVPKRDTLPIEGGDE